MERIDRIVEMGIDIDGIDDELLEDFGVEVISLVDDPAIGVGFMAFNQVDEVYEFRKNSKCPDGFEHQMPDGTWMCGKEHPSSDSYNEKAIALKRKYTFAVDEDKRIATGPLMIPNKMILRRDEGVDPYYIYFTKASIRKMSEKFFRQDKHNNTDIDHSFDITTQNTLLESWISEDMRYDKAYKLGFALPMGTWFVSYKINDDETWRRIKEGELKGFSLAGPFIEKMASDTYNDNLLNDIKKVLSKIDD